VEDAAGICLKPADFGGIVAGKDTESGVGRGVVSYDGAVFGEIEGVEGEGEVHYYGVGACDAEVVHHFCGRDTGDGLI